MILYRLYTVCIQNINNMDIKSIILDKIRQKGSINASEIVELTGFTRAYIHRFLKELRDEGKVVLLGSTHNAIYTLANKKSLEDAKLSITQFKEEFYNKNLSEENILKRAKDISGVFFGLPANISNIVEYAFLEMINNAIDHSHSKKITVSMEKESDGISFTVFDQGIGIFNTIRTKFNLPDTLTAIQLLLKGKQTTDPKRHTGQGIFFTSKAADAFVIESSGKKVRFINTGGINDIFLEDSKKKDGTIIKFFISLNSKKKIQDVFSEYTDRETFEFSKTKVLVKLSEVNKSLLSRSEARRIVVGLEKFKEVVLDFKDVDSIGQGFADEIFRVWQNGHKGVKIVWQNATENVEFMIKGAI